MIELSLILALAVPAVVCTWYAFKLENSATGLRLLFASVGILCIIGVAFTGYIFALNGASTADLYNQVDSLENISGENGRSIDAYDQQVTKNTENLLNLPSHNPYNRENWRVKVDGNEQNLQYNVTSQYEKLNDAHQLTPSPGETVTLESTESPPYVVHYELWYSWASNVNRTLETGDVVRIGAFTEENGYFFKMNQTSGTDHAYLTVRRNGTNTKSILVELNESFTEFTRFELRSNWYNVGQQTWVQTTADSSREDVQKNQILGQTAPNGVRSNGPENPQLPVRYQIHRGSGSSPVSLFAGSSNVVVAGDVDPVQRAKTDYFTESISQAGNWEPVYALRIQPGNAFILSELGSVDMAETSANTDFFVSAQQHDPRLVLTDTGDPISSSGTGWQPPEPLTSTNNAIQVTSNVSKAPNVNGTPVSNTSSLGGFQIGWGSLYSSGNKGTTGSQAQQDILRPIFGSDVVVFWVKAEDEGNPSLPASATVEYVTEQTY